MYNPNSITYDLYHKMQNDIKQRVNKQKTTQILDLPPEIVPCRFIMGKWRPNTSRK